LLYWADLEEWVKTRVPENKLLDSTVSVYPNPTTGMVLITNSELITIKRVSIYSVLGTLVSDSLDITGRANGIYIIKIETDKGTIIKKISKN
jgi:hypothetical protein